MLPFIRDKYMVSKYENIEVENSFNNIDKLLKSHKYSEVLLSLLNNQRRRIVSPYNSDLNHAWYLVGSAFYKQVEFDSALLAFKKSYNHWKEDVASIRAIGNCYSELGNPKMAKYYFIKAINIGGKTYKDLNILTYNLGNAYFDMQKYDLAISEYKKVKKFDSETYHLAQKNIEHAQSKKKDIKQYGRSMGLKKRGKRQSH